jgi:hypothetical protein
METMNSAYSIMSFICELMILCRCECDWVLGEFKAGRSPILIATDVASRGLGTFFYFASTPVQRHFDMVLCSVPA